MFTWLTRLIRNRAHSVSSPRRFLQLERLEHRWVPASLTYSSYLGGDVSDGIAAIATDSAGNVYLAGRTNSDTFPGVSGTLPPHANGFVVKMDPTATTLIWTALIDSDTNGARGVAVDSAGNVYVTGSTDVTSGFTTAGTAQSTYGGNEDAFAIKLNGQTGAVLWSTYIGGEQLDVGQAITVNQAGDAFVTGYTTSTLFPTRSPLSGQGSLHAHSGEDAFVTEISSNGSQFLFSTYLGGNQNGPTEGGATVSNANAITLDRAGNVYLTGYTEAADFPSVNAFQAVKGYAQHVFVTELESDGSQILYSTFLSGPGQSVDSGNGEDIGYGIAVDGTGNIVVTGSTTSLHFPTRSAFQGQLDRGSPALADAFVTKLNPGKTGSAQLVFSTYDGGSAIDFGEAIAVDSVGDAYLLGFSNSDTFLGKFPVVNRFQITQDPGTAFVAEFSPTGHIIFNSKYGRAGSGSGNLGADITVSPFGNVIFAGDSGSNHLQTIANAFQRTFPDETDSGFLAMLNGTPNRTFHGVDSDGDLYSVTLTGPGSISVVQNDQGNGTGPIEAIYLFGTSTISSALSVTVTKKVGDGLVDVGSITGPGLLWISAGTANLVGSGIDLTGRLGSLTIHDVTNSANFLAADLVTQSTSIHAHVIGDGSTINVGGSLSLLKAARIGAASITAPHITTLSITGDNTNGISGDLAAKVTLTGTGTALATGTITGAVSHADFEVQAGNVTTFRAGTFLDSTLFLGLNGSLITGQRLGTFTVTGIAGSPAPAFVNSNVSASIVGVVSLASVQTSNGGTKFGIEGHQSIGQVKVSNPMFTFNPKDATQQGIGDFEVRLI